MKEKLKKLVDQSLPEILKVLELQDLDPQTVAYDIDLPKIKAHGDLSINLAFHLARRLKKNPYDVAAACQNEIQKKVHADKSLQTWVQEISVERPGFINFKLTGDSLASQLLEIARLDRAFGLSKVGHGTKALIEFVSANPTGPLTIAHGRQAAIGDALARILKAVGYEVHKEFYLNDSGRQIRLLGQSLWVRYQELFGRKVSIPEEGYQGAYLIETAKSLRKDKGDALLKLEEAKVIELTSLYAIHSILEGIKKDLADARVMFDEYFSESTLYKQNQIEPILGVLNKKGFSYEADDALWFRSTQFGDDKDRVLRKKTGEYTYLAPDIAYHRNKFERGFKILINLWGPDHHGYIPRLKAACQALGYSAEHLHILIVQLATLYRNGVPVQMSTRAGEFVTLRELLDEVGVDATRFFFLLRKVDSHLDFDLELAKQKSDENPVYYLQYAHARISSIASYASSLRGGQRPTKQSQSEIASLPSVARNDGEVDLSLIKEDEALDLVKKMSSYPEVLKQAAEHLEPYRVVDYLRELAALFHQFYATHRVVGEDEPLTKARLLLIDCVRIVLRNGLEVLGVSAPKKM